MQSHSPHPSSSSSKRPSTANTSKTKASSLDGKKRAKESTFLVKYGQKHHSFDSEKAPYPLCYSKKVLELESLDNTFLKYLRHGSVTFVDFEQDETPERCLDLGCGTGTWVIDAANEWPNCEFVGFDLVNIQLPLTLLDPLVAKRISWAHGNFITTKLPFEEGEFDHIHVQNISAGVPENKWGVLLEELSRVLRPGGSIEIIEDDSKFPSLPRWFTGPLRARPRKTRSVHVPVGTPKGRYRNTQNDDLNEAPAHDHALLESLYNSVFANRFINMTPTALLPSYVDTYFRQVKICPLLSFPFPPVPPPQPMPPPMVSSYGADPGLSEALDPRASTMLLSPTTKSRPISLSFSSTHSVGSAMAPSFSDAAASITSPHTTDRSIHSVFLDDTAESIISNVFVNGDQNGKVDVGDYATEYYPKPPTRVFVTDNPLTDDTLDANRLKSLSERSLAMHLYRSYQCVLSCQEALWEEMMDRLRNRKEELRPFGWDDDDELEPLQNRKRFERLIERYRNDMETRLSLWCSLQDVGWPFPPRDPLSKAELIEEERIREAMLEAKRFSPEDDSQYLSRSLRIIIGYNP